MKIPAWLWALLAGFVGGCGLLVLYMTGGRRMEAGASNPYEASPELQLLNEQERISVQRANEDLGRQQEVLTEIASLPADRRSVALANLFNR